MNEQGRSRRVSSVLSPYNVPGNFSKSIISPNPIRGTSFSGLNEFKNGSFQMRKMSSAQNGEENDNHNNFERIAQSFKMWDNPNPPKRKETEEIDFSAQEHPILNLLSKSGNGAERKPSHFGLNSECILSPDYKPRSFSINSCGWAFANQDPNNKQGGWKGSPDMNLSAKMKNDVRANGGERLIKVSSFTRNDNYKKPSMRKATIAEMPKTIKQTSPLMFPQFSAAFKPFKKRSLSVADKSSPQVSPGGTAKKREEKAARKMEEMNQDDGIKLN